MKLKWIKFRKVKSTNEEAIKLIKKNTINPTLITSKQQTKGRGRMGKKWFSIEGNIFLSVFFKIDHNKINFKQYAILNAYLIKKVLSKYINKKIHIKWPNDLLIERHKVCGILQEVIDYKENKILIIGIGINTLRSPDINKLKATYLSKFTRKKVDNNKIIKDIKKVYEKLIKEINENNFLKLKNKIR